MTNIFQRYYLCSMDARRKNPTQPRNLLVCFFCKLLPSDRSIPTHFYKIKNTSLPIVNHQGMLLIKDCCHIYLDNIKLKKKKQNICDVSNCEQCLLIRNINKICTKEDYCHTNKQLKKFFKLPVSMPFKE